MSAGHSDAAARVREAGYSPAQIAQLLGQHRPTAEQSQIIAAPLRPAVVIAGAGSGKTETMAARVLWLVANELVEPERVLGLTFTRKAAGELQSRIRQRLRSLWRALGRDPQDAGEPTVLTYAAYAGRLVDEHGLLAGVEAGARLLTEAARWQLADEVVRGYDGRFSVDPGVVATVTERTLELAGQLADHLAEPSRVGQLSDRLRAELHRLGLKPRGRRDWPEKVERFLDTLTRRQELLPLVERFAAAKRAAAAVDFADQMVLASRLATLPSVVEAERSRYGVVLLDEYQDTGHAQIELLAALFGDGRAVTAVGDPLQSIYSWRGASAGNIGRFSTRFRGPDGAPARVYPLMTSWRNDREVLRVANAVSEQLREPGAAPLRVRDEAGQGSVLAGFHETVADEAGWIAHRLSRLWHADCAGQATPARDNATPATDTAPAGHSGQRAAAARSMAVLVRKRSAIPLIAQAIRDAGLPVEVVDLGGLLSLPEIADVRAALQTLTDHRAGGSLARLLTGARWRVGAADLAALHRRARSLAPDGEHAEISLVEAVDDLGPPGDYSAEGYRRLSECGAILRGLRHRLSLPLPDLIVEVERALGLDVEVAVRAHSGHGVHSAHADRANLDRFIDEAARFDSERRRATAPAFLAYLAAAEQEEYGLKPADVEVRSDRVQILTVHGSKGLEWDVVAVAGLVAGSFPDAARGHDWASAPTLLPSPLRGDRGELPTLDFAGCAHRGEAEERLVAHRAALAERHLREERRLAYVAFTRARSVLLLSGAAWGSATKARLPSPFLVEARQVIEADGGHLDGWFEPDLTDSAGAGATNPLLHGQQGVPWPADPLAGRREAVAAASAAVRAALADEPADSDAAGAAAAHEQSSIRARRWRDDVDLLLAERAAAAAASVIEVAAPAQLSVSDVVAMTADPQGLAARLRRPVPQRPARAARRGTSFHTWLERRWSAESLIDIDELPGAVDEQADEAELDALKSAFEASEWADRTPVAVEAPFEMSFDGRVVRGRMDAVFAEPDGRYLVVDWKTGRPPTGAHAQAKAVQLALYRLAWAGLAGIADDEIESVSAAFHYVSVGRTIAPANLLTAAELRALVNG